MHFETMIPRMLKTKIWYIFYVSILALGNRIVITETLISKIYGFTN